MAETSWPSPPAGTTTSAPPGASCGSRPAAGEWTQLSGLPTEQKVSPQRVSWSVAINELRFLISRCFERLAHSRSKSVPGKKTRTQIVPKDQSGLLAKIKSPKSLILVHQTQISCRGFLFVFGFFRKLKNNIPLS